MTLAEGDNVVKVEVTATDTTTATATLTYTVTVTRRAVDAPGEEGDLRLMEKESYTATDRDRYEGVSGRAEIFHAGRWGTVSSDGFSKETIHFRFAPDLDADGVPTGTFMES